MKVLCNKHTDESLHIFSDSTEVYISNNSLWFKYKEKEDFEIKGFDDENFIIYETVSVPKNWTSRTFKYNPDYGWKPANTFNYKKESYELFLESFLKLCLFLKEKNILTEEEYQHMIDFSEIEKLLYHPIFHYM